MNKPRTITITKPYVRFSIKSDIETDFNFDGHLEPLVKRLYGIAVRCISYKRSEEPIFKCFFDIPSIPARSYGECANKLGDGIDDVIEVTVKKTKRQFTKRYGTLEKAKEDLKRLTENKEIEDGYVYITKQGSVFVFGTCYDLSITGRIFPYWDYR